MAFSRIKVVIARRAFFARRSNLGAGPEIATPWEEHPGLAMTQIIVAVKET